MSQTDAEKKIQVVTFLVNKEELAFDIFKVKEIIRVPDITMVPKSPYFIKGVINLRGTIIPIVDLRKRFALESIENEKRARIIIIELEASQVGFLVDMVLGIRKIERNTIELPSSIMNEIENDCITGIAKTEDSIVILLNINKVLETKTCHSETT